MLLESFHLWLKKCILKLSRNSDVAVAIQYALGRWMALLRYVNDGRLEIDNNVPLSVRYWR
jgi:transposase